MAKKEVLLLGHPKLREESSKITDFEKELASIVEDLKDTLTHLQREKGTGRALAAPQIGYTKKVVYVQMPQETIVLVNPEIVDKSEETFWVWDNCFSFDMAFYVKIPRFKEIKVEYQNSDGEPIRRRFRDDLSELLQHEIDHLHGVLATDHLTDNRHIIMRQEWEKRHRD